MPGRPHRRNQIIRRWASALLCVAMLIAAGRSGRAEPEPVLEVAVGHGGATRSNYYFPVRVKIAWVSKPGEPNTGEPEAARVEVRVPQDVVYTPRISRDVTIQPGKPSTVVLYARSLREMRDIEVELRDRRGRLMARAKANAMGTTGWWTIDDDQAIVMVAGKSTMPRSGWVFDHGNVSPVKVEELQAADLPREWPGYDGVSLVVLEDLQTERLDVTQIRTLLDWVRQGGCLAVTVTHQLDTYLQVLGAVNLPLALGDYNSTNFDPALSEVLQGAIAFGLDPSAKRPTPGRDNLLVKSESSMGWYSQYLPILQREIAELSGRFLYSRPIELTPEAMGAGWTVRRAEEWHNPMVASGSEGRSTGNIATGPYGLGSITLIGIDPASLAGGSARELRGVGWWHCLSHLAAIRDALASAPVPSGGYGGAQSSVDTTLATSAVNEILDDLSMPLGAGHGLFGAIAVALLLLVLLIGPVDYFVLRWAAREPLTWVTCPILVVLACAAIYFAQQSVSYGRARASRLSVVDAWSGSMRGAATSFTAVSSARGGRYTLDGLGDGTYASPTCWNPPYWYYYGADAAGATVPIEQGSGGSRVVSVSIPLENVRWFQERGSIDLPEITGIVRVDRSHDRVTVDVTGPSDWTGRVVAAYWNGGWYKADEEGAALSGGRLVDQMLPRDPGDKEAAKLRSGKGEPNSWGYYQTDWVAGWVNDLSFQIPGHREIGRRLEALGPEYAAILISFDHRSDVQLTREGSRVDAEWTERMRVRLLVPAEELAKESGGDRP